MAKLLKVGVLASGRGSNLQAIIDASEKGELSARVVVVVSDKAGARALERARAHGIPAVYLNPREYSTREEYDRAVADVLEAHGVEVVALAGYMRIVTGELLDRFPNRVLNIHPSLLPAFPGLEAQRQALEHGVKFSGCTVHFADGGLDSGPIIAQAVVPVLPDDTTETLADRILAEEHKLYPLVLQWLAEDRVRIFGRKVVILPPTDS